jgi:hypothetical protein
MSTASVRQVLLVGSILALGLTGCSSAADGPTPSTATTSATTSVTAQASPGPTGTAPAPAGTPSAPSGPTRCTADQLDATVTDGDGGAAGSVLPYLVLTNTSSVSCTLQGWPGVSFVGNGDGTQIGAAGDMDTSSPHDTVLLAPGGSAHSPLRISNALNYSAADCDPLPADGLRVFPPGETESLFAPTTDLTACQDSSVHLITVRGLVPGA